MREVFANTTPLQYPHRFGRLDWLREFYGRTTVPMAAVDELEADFSGGVSRTLETQRRGIRQAIFVVNAVPPPAGADSVLRDVPVADATG